MTTMNYIGLDVHKKTISYCVKDASGRIQQEGKIGSTRRIVSGLAENTNSIFCDGSSEPETANGCLVLPSAGTDAERHTLRVEHPGNDDLHALPSVPGTPVPPLDR